MSEALLYAAGDFQDPSGDAYVKGVILTALAGALGTVLTLLGIIVKGVIDNLTIWPGWGWQKAARASSDSCPTKPTDFLPDLAQQPALLAAHAAQPFCT